MRTGQQLTPPLIVTISTSQVFVWWWLISALLCRPEQERAAGVEHPAQRHRQHRPRPALPPRGLAAQGRAPGPQGQQRAPRPQDEPQDLRLRHGQDLRGRRRRHQHRPRRRNIVIVKQEDLAS